LENRAANAALSLVEDDPWITICETLSAMLEEIQPGPGAWERSGTCACHREEAVRPTRRSLRQAALRLFVQEIARSYSHCITC